jgi:hypothetical protein
MGGCHADDGIRTRRQARAPAPAGADQGDGAEPEAVGARRGKFRAVCAGVSNRADNVRRTLASGRG